ncbi:MAG: Fe2+-dependent dioxygenase [Paracoccaceae bacterium]
MILALQNVLTEAETAAIRKMAEKMPFADGAATAGRFAREIKANDQAAPSPELEGIRGKVAATLAAHRLFQSAARPRGFTPLILSRYREGQTYGVHVDDALMGGLRTDISFTLFLCPPESYEGGALIIADGVEERAFKPGAGDMILYPSTSLHRVEPVSGGTRLALVGWVQSWIRDPAQREILFDLDRSIDEIHAKDGKTALFDQLAKSRSNLLRMWATG